MESDGQLAFINRRTAKTVTATVDDMVETEADAAPFALTRGQEDELPASLKLLYADAATDYRNAVASALRPASLSRREALVEMPCATNQATAQARATVMLQESWSLRERMTFALPPSWLTLEPGDVIDLGTRQLRIEQIKDGVHRQIEARSYEQQVYLPAAAPERAATIALAPVYGPADVAILDLPIVASATPHSPWMAASAKPWPGSLAVLRQSGAATFTLNRLIEARATMGRTLTTLNSGPLHLFDRGSTRSTSSSTLVRSPRQPSLKC